MQDKIITLILQQAAQAEGSTQALASRLNAPEPTLVRWMTGRAQTPLRAFLAVLDFLMQQERKNGEPSGQSERTDVQQPDELVFPLGQLFARCARCDGTEFRLAEPGGLRLTSWLTCTACQQSVIHGDLLAQLAKDAVHHSRAVAVRAKRAVNASRARLERGQQSLDASARRLRPTQDDE